MTIGGVTVLGLDTGFASVGWCVARMVGPIPQTLCVEALGVFRTESSAKKLNIKVGDDDFDRSRAISRHLRSIVLQYCPRLITCESYSPPRNAGVTGKIGRCFGVLAAITEHSDLACVHATPQELKKAVTGVKNAGKEDVQKAVDTLLHNAPRKLLDKDGVPGGQREHAYDALASIIACWDSEPMRLARRW